MAMKECLHILQRRTLAAAAVTGALALLGGCGPVAVKDVVANPREYMSRNLTVSSLDDPVKGYLKALPLVTLPFDDIEITQRDEYQSTTGGHPFTRIDHLYLQNAGNGMVQFHERWAASNGIEGGGVLGLAYRNLLPLKSLIIRYDRQFAGRPGVAKRFVQFPQALLDPGPHAEIDMQWESGTDTQFANFNAQRLDCHAGDWQPANTLNPAIPGRMLELKCAILSNSLSQGEWQLAYLDQFGVFIYTGYDSTTVHRRGVITAFTVKRPGAAVPSAGQPPAAEPSESRPLVAGPSPGTQPPATASAGVPLLPPLPPPPRDCPVKRFPSCN